MKKLEELWTLVPDWRLGQVISNLQGAGVHQYGDIFHPDDEQWEKWIDTLLIEFKKDI